MHISKKKMVHAFLWAWGAPFLMDTILIAVPFLQSLKIISMHFFLSLRSFCMLALSLVESINLLLLSRLILKPSISIKKKPYTNLWKDFNRIHLDWNAVLVQEIIFDKVKQGLYNVTPLKIYTV